MTARSGMWKTADDPLAGIQSKAWSSHKRPSRASPYQEAKRSALEARSDVQGGDWSSSEGTQARLPSLFPCFRPSLPPSSSGGSSTSRTHGANLRGHFLLKSTSFSFSLPRSPRSGRGPLPDVTFSNWGREFWNLVSTRMTRE